MASYKIVNADQLDADLAAVADSIRAKGKTTVSLSFPAGFQEAVANISTGIVVQRKSGTFTINSNGTATVSCGFKPDLVCVHKKEASNNYMYSAASAFQEDSRTDTGVSCLALWSTTSGVTFYELDLSRNNTGFTVTAYAYADDWNSSTPTNTVFQYTAVKYT